jgi:hypothetical protein
MYLIDLIRDVGLELELPAIIMEAVITVAEEESTLIKRCKHFLMIINYVREAVKHKFVSMHKIAAERNSSDVLTKKLRGSQFGGIKLEKIPGTKRGMEAIIEESEKTKRRKREDNRVNCEANSNTDTYL